MISCDRTLKEEEDDAEEAEGKEEGTQVLPEQRHLLFFSLN